MTGSTHQFQVNAAATVVVTQLAVNRDLGSNERQIKCANAVPKSDFICFYLQLSPR